MRIFSFIFLLAVCAASSWATEQEAQKHRVLISTDIGGTDPDDNQSMTHLLMYNDLFDLEGLVSSPSYGNGSVGEILRMIDLYEKDYPVLKAHRDGFLTPDSLRTLCKQGHRGLAPFIGYDSTSEGSEWIVKCARRESDRPLWVLVWGGLEDVAQALHDAPDIQDRIKIYWIGGPNKKWSVNSYCYIVENFPNLWFIENNASYRGFIAESKNNGHYHRGYYNDCLRGAGALGDDFANYYGGFVKMGDTPALLYMMNGNPYDPTGESWGGSFERQNISPRRVFHEKLCDTDTVAVYSVVELHIAGPKIDKLVGTPCFIMTVDRQEWTGEYLGDGDYCIRYAPKEAATLNYTIKSDIQELNGLSGSFVVSKEWPGVSSADTWSVGKTWFTDKADPQLFEGLLQGYHTTSKWRKEVLDDWTERLSWLKK